MAIGLDAVLTEGQDGIWDINLNEDGDVETINAFDTYIKVALHTDIRAEASEVSIPQYRRGWIGNEGTPGFEMGSKLWLLFQAELTQDNVNRAEEYARQALQKMVDEGLAISVRVVGVMTSEGIGLNIKIIRPDSAVALRYFDLWEFTAAKGNDGVTAESLFPPFIPPANFNSWNNPSSRGEFYSDNKLVGISNKFTFAFWWRMDPYLNFAETTNLFQIRSNPFQNENSIRMLYTSPFSTPDYFFQLQFWAGDSHPLSSKLNYSTAVYGPPTPNGGLQFEEWVHICVSVDGTATLLDQIVLRMNGAPDNKTCITNCDSIASMADAQRTMTLGGSSLGGGGNGKGTFYDFALWDKAFTYDEQTAVYNSGTKLNLLENSGDYVSKDNLVHYYQPGKTGVLEGMGTDYGTRGDMPLNHLNKPIPIGNIQLGVYPGE